jgi:hypothetical protein
LKKNSYLQKNVVENDDGHIEINPEDLFQNVIKVLRDAIVGMKRI